MTYNSILGFDKKLLALDAMSKYDVKNFASFDSFVSVSRSVASMDIAPYFTGLNTGETKSICFIISCSADYSSGFSLTRGVELSECAVSVCGFQGYTANKLSDTTIDDETMFTVPSTEFSDDTTCFIKVVVHKL